MIPAHVPQHLVYDFDFLNDPRLSADIHQGVETVVREAPPIFYTPRNGGHWVLARYQVIADAARDTGLFSSHQMSMPRMADEPVQIPINLDPPEHGVYREVLSKAFSPRAVAALEADIRRFTDQLIDAVVGQGSCDFVHAVAEPLPVTIFMRLVGMPLERLPEFRVWVKEIITTPDPAVRARAFGQVHQAMGELIHARQRKREDDLISRMLDEPIGGREVTFEEMQNYCLLLFIAGLDTVVNGMAFGIRHLAGDPPLQRRLRAEPALIPQAVEELLRRYTFTNPGRIVARDETFHGVDFKSGDMVLLLLPAADLDGEAFENPTATDIDRENKRHIAFNLGPHRCVGSHLARLELRVLYEQWLRRIPEFSPDPARPATFAPGYVMGVTSLPLRWRAA